MSEVFGWAVCRPLWGKGEPVLSTVARTRAQAIEKALELWGSNYDWRRLYRQGWRVRHVSVKPILFDALPHPQQDGEA